MRSHPNVWERSLGSLLLDYVCKDAAFRGEHAPPAQHPAPAPCLAPLNPSTPPCVSQLTPNPLDYVSKDAAFKDVDPAAADSGIVSALLLDGLVWLQGCLAMLSDNLDATCFRSTWSAAAAAINRCVSQRRGRGVCVCVRECARGRAPTCAYIMLCAGRRAAGPFCTLWRGIEGKPLGHRHILAAILLAAGPLQLRTGLAHTTCHIPHPPSPVEYRELFNLVATEHIFSAAGARQLGTDVGALVRVFAPFTRKPLSHFRELADAVTLLQLADEQAAWIHQVGGERSGQGGGAVRGL